MPITQSQLTRAEMKRKAENHVCQECESRLTVAWGGSYGIQSFILRCAKDIRHEGIMRPFRLSAYDTPGFNLVHFKKKEKELSQRIGATQARSLAPYQQAGALSRVEATSIITTIWPRAPQVEVVKAAIVCSQYGLNPLMKHLYLMPFKNRNGGEDWVMVFGIKSSRLMASRQGRYSYLDDSPRFMTAEEGKKILGGEYRPEEKTYFITRLKDMGSGAMATGIGSWPKATAVYGSDKGNTPANMASIRSERQALERLYPEALPKGREVMDERFMPEISVDVTTGEVREPAGEVIEGESRVVENQAEAAPAETAQAQQVPMYGFIESSFLDEAMVKLKRGWPQTEMMKWLRNEGGVAGTTVVAAASKLTAEKAVAFTQKIQEMLDAS